ncbi:M10 family metallopeptidase C-terminal domain-containing protein [Roseomonas sp. HJA6]|uniref:M10 family metallopeptidase C-terminal domain-containing protein n=1 Tax=Roseomonas alba TaxID=2846776 RepID=A0ABS7AK34_9PROT|nr:calcium-binding protein [Neoroseomonas alba]MBW6401494.1 M10 family metallopeptidase C-terminal domain-containing protein [Neoroseomonas alba]
MSGPVIRITGSSLAEISPGYGTLLFTVTLDEVSAVPITVQYRTIGGTAMPGVDYSDTGVATLTIPAGQPSGTISIALDPDTVDERDESVVVELFNPTGGAGFAGNQPSIRATGVILDDDGAASNLALFVSDATVIEGDSGAGQAAFELRLSRPATTPMTFTYATKDGSATAGQDYTATKGTVVFGVGESSKTVTVAVSGDNAMEVTEAFFLAVTPSGNALAGATGTATILDDDAGGAPVVSLAGGVLTEISPGYGTLIYTLTLSEASAAPVSVQYRAMGGTALTGDDYADTGVRTVTFAAGQTVKTIDIQVKTDALDEIDESVVVEVFNPTGGAALEGGQPSLRAIGTILDDDGAGSNLALFVSDPKVIEGDAGKTKVVFELHLSQPATASMTFTYATQDGSAVAGQDYTAKTGSVTFAAGQQTAFVTIDVVGNAVAENNESFFLTVKPSSAAVAGTTGMATILDDDTGGGVVPVVSVSGGVLNEITSGYGTLVYTITLSEPSAASVTLQYRIVGGTALSGTDYAEDGTRTVTFAPGQTVATVEVSVAHDTLDERDESVVLEVFNPTGGVVLPAGQPSIQAIGVIRDNDGAGSNLSLFVSDPQLIEGDAGVAQAVFELRLSQPATSAMTFTYSTQDGSAVAGQDYTAKTGSVTFAVGQQTAFVTVNVTGNTAAENNESFFLTVTPDQTGLLGATGMATILDDDTGGGSVPVISVKGGTLNEITSGYGTLLYTVTLSEPSTAPVTVHYRIFGGTALAGVDVEQHGDVTITFAAGQTVKTIEVAVASDSLDEVDESVVLELFNPGGGAVFAGNQPTIRATGVILDDDGAGSNLALFVSDPQIIEGNAGLRQAVFELRLSRPGETAQTFDFATSNLTALAGSDYVAKTGSVTFAAGQQTAFVTVDIVGNAVAEASETFALTVTPRDAGMGSVNGTATILDDDAGGGGVPVISARAGVLSEISSGYGQLFYTITLSQASTAAISVSYRTLTTGTATSGIDFSARNTIITFAAGETSRTVVISLGTDSLLEPNETVVLELFGATGGAVFAGGATTLQVAGVIIDNDGPHSGGAGNDTMSGTGVGDTLRGADGHDSLLGQGGDDSLLGGTGNDTLDGGTGGDTLDGGLGKNVLRGGAGDDFYVFDETPDTVVEAANAGIDTLLLTGAGAAPTLGMMANVERAVVLGAARGVIGNGLDNLIVGGSGNDTFNGGAGHDTLDGGLGNDRLLGGTGNDLYIVNSQADVVIEGANQGIDTVRTTAANHTLQANVENLEAAGAIAHTLTGNALANLITGNVGNDTLLGGAGADTLDGGLGTDRLVGGGGNDFYIVTPGDVVVEGANQGIDTVSASGGGGVTLTGNVEVLLLGGDLAMNGVGNGLGNRIEGNSAANTLNGLGGADSLFGGGGADVLIGGTGTDSLTGGAGNDLFRFTSVADSTVAAPDVILDFVSIPGQIDRVDLRSIDANPFVAGNQAFAFIGAAAFDGDGAASAGQVRVQTLAAGRFRAEADVDGNGAADFAVEIHSANTPAAGWFLL